MIIPETWVDEVKGADGERKKVVLVQMQSSKTVGTWYVAYFFFLCMVGRHPSDRNTQLARRTAIRPMGRRLVDV